MLPHRTTRRHFSGMPVSVRLDGLRTRVGHEGQGQYDYLITLITCIFHLR